MSVEIKKPWETLSKQIVTSDSGDVWKITDVIDQAKHLPELDIPLEHLCIDKKIGGMSIREFVGHMRLVLDSDLSFPIILDEDGGIFDGRHRVAKALLREADSIKAVRFKEDPPPTYNEKDK